MRTLLLAVLAAASVLLGGCSGGDAPDLDPDPPGPREAETVRFILLGDTGTGEEPQYEVARAVGQVCAERGCDFATILGDLVYPSGVTSPDDPQFDSKFEEPYAGLGFPFYNVLGNHDNSGGPHGDGGLGTWAQAGDHMVAYHYRTDRASDKWRMPARFYNASVGPVDLFALDTNTLLYYGVQAPASDAAAHVQEQEAWIDGALQASGAPWKLSLGHHPYVSNGLHGDAGSYDGLPGPPLDGEHVRAFYEEHVCSRVDLILAGHDHDLQWLKAVPACGATEFIVSGAGSQPRPLVGDPSEDAHFGQGGTLGFWWAEADAETFHAVAYDSEGAVLFERTLTK